MTDPSTASSSRHVLGLCFLAAMLEGYDIQSAGVAAAALVGAFGLAPAELGLVFSANVIGLLFGAAFGGRLSDRVGRKAVLVVSVAVFGLFSLLTPVAGDLAWLVALRFLTGLGLGGAMPNLIALAAESGPVEGRVSRVVLMFSGMPLGAIGAGAVGVVVAGGVDWRLIFQVGGVLPLLLVPVLIWRLKAGAADRSGRADGGGLSTALLGEGRALNTLLLWIAFFFTLLVLYLMLNWLPSLLQAKGVGKAEAMGVSMAFNLGGVFGAFGFGWATRRGVGRGVIAALFVGMAVGLLALAGATGGAAMMVAAVVAGVFIISGQFVLYGLSPTFYPTAVRGAGVGAAVAVGRLGSAVGPLAAGVLISAGGDANAILVGALGAVLLAGLSAITLRREPFAPAEPR